MSEERPRDVLRKPKSVNDVQNALIERIETQLEVDCVNINDEQLEEVLSAVAGEKVEELLKDYVRSAILKVQISS